MAINAIGHIGVCVSDLERALRFWRDGLGFEVLREWTFRGSSWRRVLEIEGELDLHSRIIRRDHMTLELMWFQKPGHKIPSGLLPMNQVGYTHLAVWVDDIEAQARRIVEYGGTVLESTRTIFDHPNLRGKWLICADPDGTRIELVEYPDGEDLIER